MADEDWGQYSQCPSLRGRPNAARLHGKLLQPATELVRHRVHIAVREMLHNELELGEEYAVFYHSYSASCLLYELQTALATRLFGYPLGGPPVTRLSREPFCHRDSLAALVAMQAELRSDHHDGFRKVAISAVVSWFASGGYGHSLLMRHFLSGWFGGHDLGDMSAFLEEALRACGVPEARLAGLVGEVLAVGDKWGLDMSRYKDRGGRRWLREHPSCPGHILQVFVHSSVVDSVAYGALPLGRLAPGGSPISPWLARQCPLDGQARLLVHPDLFLDHGSGLVRVFTHSGSPMYGEAQRLSLLRDLDAVLAPHFAGPQATCLARAGLGFVVGGNPAGGEDLEAGSLGGTAATAAAAAPDVGAAASSLSSSAAGNSSAGSRSSDSNAAAAGRCPGGGGGSGGGEASSV